MNARGCQLFEVCQHEFVNVSLPCEGRFRLQNVKSIVFFFSFAQLTRVKIWTIFRVTLALIQPLNRFFLFPWRPPLKKSAECILRMIFWFHVIIKQF